MSLEERGIPPEPTATVRTADPDFSERDWLDGAYRDHQGAVTAAARRVCGPEHAVDVAQDVFLTLWRSPDKFARTAGRCARS